MELPKLDIAALPELDSVTGLFGSLSDLTNVTMDDRIVILMVFVYEAFPPEALAGF